MPLIGSAACFGNFFGYTESTIFFKVQMCTIKFPYKSVVKMKTLKIAVTVLSFTGFLFVQNTAWSQQSANGNFAVLKEGKVTEDDLIKALTPAPVGAATQTDEEMGGKSRGIRLSSPSAVASAAAKPAKANLLITFVTNSVELTTRAKQTLDIVARSLGSEKLSAFRFNIEGHADPRGKSDDNLRLSQGRAESVKSYLVSAHKIGADRLNPVGKGDREPLVPDQPTAPENRRVTFVTNQ
jgi:OmpA-OmpF porin, OOP family